MKLFRKRSFRLNLPNEPCTSPLPGVISRQFRIPPTVTKSQSEAFKTFSATTNHRIDTLRGPNNNNNNNNNRLQLPSRDCISAQTFRLNCPCPGPGKRVHWWHAAMFAPDEMERCNCIKKPKTKTRGGDGPVNAG